MEKKGFVRLMLLFLGFSYLLLSCAAVPSTSKSSILAFPSTSFFNLINNFFFFLFIGSLKSNKELPSSVQDLLAQDVMELSYGEEVIAEGDGFNGERMLMESTDYPGTGANKNHDPKTPGRA
ncbi:hypothetical protein PVK06_040522 [Gossypium arboreum]|uniref:Uncharacterized protein n=1 Tax=Gossypium arboreum TaxID=29729 RepID=A0ABR0N5Q3_GOSAR|nr:hypothetical protein PVK06_040522 [Gossypium arboreum]